MDPLTVLCAFAPALVDTGKGLIARFIAPKEFKPATIEQYSAMRGIELQWFQAINAAGGSGSTYAWVEAAVRLMRPGVALVVMLTWAAIHVSNLGGSDTAGLDNFAAMVGFYLFGDRTLFYSRREQAGRP
jgi:hypothetical protein